LQKRLPKYRRVPEAVEGKAVTDRGMLILTAISRYRFISTSDIIRLVGGNEDVTYRHLQQLYHQDLVSRVALPRNGSRGEFAYFLDNSKELRKLVEHSKLDAESFDWKQIRANREKYGEAGHEGVGRFLFLQHELMISHFRTNLELECKQSDGRIELEKWIQGSAIWSVVAVDSRHNLPHRPDAFFTLRFPNAPEGQQRSNFFYEADRQTSSMPRFKQKLEGHLFFLLQGRHKQYGIQKIRAVLVHTLKVNWEAQLKRTAAQLAASEPLAAHLFWFTSSEELSEMESIFHPHFSLLADERKRSLLD
jgi:hypothetical protein